MDEFFVAILAMLMAYSVVGIVIAVLAIIGTWKVFTKAGIPGWASLVPFYSQYCLFQMAFGNGWLFLLCLVPCVNLVILVICYIKLAQSFGKGAGFGVGLIFLNPIFLMILGFGDSTYIGPSN